MRLNRSQSIASMISMSSFNFITQAPVEDLIKREQLKAQMLVQRHRSIDNSRLKHQESVMKLEKEIKKKQDVALKNHEEQMQSGL